MPAEEVAGWRERARALLLNHEACFDLEWRKFFYIDEFPENAKRFDVTIDDCRPAEKGGAFSAARTGGRQFLRRALGRRTASTQGVIPAQP